jgi:hypothetical protein
MGKKNGNKNDRDIKKSTLKQRLLRLFKRIDILLYFVVPVSLFAIYLRTLLPGLGYSGDTAKFQFLGKILGIPHPTGYPTYLILNHVFVTLFPFGELAFRANLLSAIFAVLAVVILMNILRLVEIDPFIAAVMSFSFGVTRTFWAQSLVAEVYTLNLLFMCLVVFFLLKWNLQGRDRHLLIAWAVYMISFGNHAMMSMLLPAIVFLVWRTDRSVLRDFKRLLIAALLALIGAMQYLYIVWRAHDPATAYMEYYPRSIKLLLWYMSGGWFKHSMFAFPFHTVCRVRLPMLVGFLDREFSFLLLLGLIGLIAFQKKSLRLFLLLCWFGMALVPLNYDISDVAVYFIPVYLFTAIFISLGAQWLSMRLPLKKALILLIPLSLLLIHYNRVDQSHNRREAERARSILQMVRRDALIVTADYNASEYLWYYLLGQGMQKEKNIYVQNRFDIDQIRDYLDGGVPFFVTNQNLRIPTGLSVYVIGKRSLAILEKSGLSVIPVRDDLFRVMAKP